MRPSLLKEVHHFAVHYGGGVISDLTSFDLAVVEPAHYTPTEISWLQSRGTRVLAYVSVVEIGDYHDLFSNVSREDFLFCDGEPMRQPAYGTYLLDLTSARWRGTLLHHVGTLLTQGGYDGVFLDTIGDVEMPNLPDSFAQVDAAVQFVQNIRRWFPDAWIVQNNGLELLCLRTAQWLDGIVWENPPIDDKESVMWVARITDRLHELAKSHQVASLLLFDGMERMERPALLVRRRFADSHGFPIYFAHTHYQSEVQVQNRNL